LRRSRSDQTQQGGRLIGLIEAEDEHAVLSKDAPVQVRDRPGKSQIPTIDRNIFHPLKVSFLGNCQFDPLVKAFLGSGHRIRHVWMGSDIHSLIPDPLADDDLAVIDLSLRHILSDGSGLPIPAIGHDFCENAIGRSRSY
jgi:hypothetical protein